MIEIANFGQTKQMVTAYVRNLRVIPAPVVAVLNGSDLVVVFEETTAVEES